MQVEIGGHAVEPAGAVEHRRAQPHRMRGRADQRRIAFQPFAIDIRSEEHTSELQSLMRISYAVFCLKKHTSINRIIHLTATTPRYNNYRTNLTSSRNTMTT